MSIIVTQMDCTFARVPADARETQAGFEVDARGRLQFGGADCLVRLQLHTYGPGLMATDAANVLRAIADVIDLESKQA